MYRVQIVFLCFGKEPFMTFKKLVIGLYAASLLGAEVTWDGTLTDNNLNDAANWNPDAVPTNSDTAIFDSSVANINTSPTASGTDFNVDILNFPHLANSFTFTFQNIEFNMHSITGTYKNPTFNITNTDNASEVGYQLYIAFGSGTSDLGSAIFNISNEGTLLGSTIGTTISSIDDYIVYVNSEVNFASGAKLIISNLGTDLTADGGNNKIAEFGSAFLEFDKNVTVEDNVLFSISNTGMSQATGQTSNSEIACGNSEYGVVFNQSLTAGNYFTLTASNRGDDRSQGYGGNQIALIPYAFLDLVDCTVGAHATFTVTNAGYCSGSNTDNGNSVGHIEGEQLYFREEFTAGDYLNVHLSNIGTDSSVGFGQNKTAYINDNQLQTSDVTIGSYATFLIENSGTFTGDTTWSNDTGYVSANQAEFAGEINGADFLKITISNRGVSSGNITNQANSVGYISRNQLYFDGGILGDNLLVVLSNYGEDSNSGGGYNGSAVIGNCQLETNDTSLQVGKSATFLIVNSGIFSGSSVGDNGIGYIDGSQADFACNFTAGDFLKITITNYGENSGQGDGDNNIANPHDGQLVFSGNSVQIGDYAKIVISNEGTTTANTQQDSYVGYVDNSQFESNAAFSAGKNLLLSAVNQATISGNSTSAGSVDYQLNFTNSCTLGDGSFLTASNLGQGTVRSSQILFENGFLIPTGSATIQAINEGSVAGYGIQVQAGLGGNAHLVMQNAKTYISSSETQFTVGSLTGDSDSTVQSQPLLVIATDSSVNATFAGDIQDYGDPSALTKTGSGIQKLSGTNTFTGLTTVDEGTLIVTGSLAGEISVSENGILQGTGSIGGNAINVGTISPGESIGTIHFLGNYSSTGGFYEVEVNGLGQSDLIDVTGDATISDGLLIVSSVDGSYKFQDRYTVLTAEGSRNGFYEGANAVSSMVQPIVTYDAQNVYLTLFTQIANIAKTPNELAVAELLDGIVGPTAQQNLLLSQLVDSSDSQARASLNRLSGYQQNADRIVSLLLNRQFLRTLFDPIRSIVTREPNSCKTCCSSLFTPWIDLQGIFMSLDANQGLDARSAGYNISLGAQTTIQNCFTLGVAAAYEEDFMAFKKSGGKEISRTWLAGIYALYRPNYFYALADFVMDFNHNYLNRDLQVGALYYHAKSHPKYQQYTFYGELGGDISFYKFLLQPFAGVEVRSFDRNSLSENNPEGFGLLMKSQNSTASTSRLGVHFTTNQMNQSSVNLSIDLAWDYYFGNTKNRGYVEFQDFGTPFVVSWSEIDRNSLDYAITLSSLLYKCLEGHVKFSGLYGSHANLFNVVAGLEYRW